MLPFFITATGTGIGKTMVTTSLVWQLRQSGKSVVALKPVISGYDANDLNNDTAQILMSCGIEPTPQAQENISPFRYRAPLAPNMAAAKEGHPVDLSKLIVFCDSLPKPHPDVLLVEGVGGIMSPLNDQHTVLDWMEAMGWPVMLVAGTYLGSISHTLSAVETLKTNNIPIHAIILSESQGNDVSLGDTASTLEKFVPEEITIVKIPRLDRTDAIWKQVSPISWLCQNPQKIPKA